MMKKITVVSDFYPPHWTGISKSIAYIVDSIQNNFLSTVLTVQFDKELVLKEKTNNLTIIRCPTLFSLSRAKFSLALIINFLKNIRQTDLVLINSPSIHILPISLISKLFKKKLLIFHQGDLILPKGIINNLIEKVFDLASYISFSLARQLVTYTDDYVNNSRLLPNFAKKTSTFIPPLPYFQVNKKNRDIDLKIKNRLIKLRKQNKILIGFAGRFVEEKGFDILLEAVFKLRERNKDFMLVFAGEKNVVYEKTFEKNQRLIKQLENNLIFLGLLDDNQLQSFYQSIDLFVLPSRSECFGLVQAEAMAQKTPVLVANIPGARDPVVKTDFGLVFEQNNVDDLAKKIEEILIQLKIFNKNYEKVLNYFDYQQSKTKLLNFLIK